MQLDDISLVLLDVDGVLTDGSLWIGDNGEIVKKFYVRDGLGITLLKKHGIDVGIVTGRFSTIVLQRAQELKIDIVYQGVSDKLSVYEKILEERHLGDAQVAYMGDDLPDIPILKRVGLPAAPCDAVSEVLNIALFCAPYPGGLGAVRALAEFILKRQNKWCY